MGGGRFFVFVLADEFGVESAQFDAGVGGRELPVDVFHVCVPVAFPGGNLVRQSLSVVDSPGQTLSPQHTVFAFGNIQPTAVLRRVMNIEPFGKPSGFLRSKCFVERGRRVRVQVVHHQHDTFGVLVLLVQQSPQSDGPIDPSPPLRHTHMPPSTQRLAEHEDVARAATFILAVIPQRLARFGRQRLTHLGHELVRQQPQSPTGAPLGSGTTAGGHKFRFRLAVEFACPRRTLLFLPVEGGFQALFDPTPTNVEYRLGCDIQGLRDFGVCPGFAVVALVGFEQNPGPCERKC